MSWLAHLKLMAKVSPTVAYYQLGLAFVPFSTLARRSFSTHQRASSDARPSADSLARAVSSLSAFFPRSTCLGRSLATVAVLRRHRFPASLRLGVTRDAEKRILGHAWVELDGRVLSDDRAGQFVPLDEIEDRIS